MVKPSDVGLLRVKRVPPTQFNYMNRAVFVDNYLGSDWICLASKCNESGEIEIYAGVVTTIDSHSIHRTLAHGIRIDRENLEFLMEKHDE